MVQRSLNPALSPPGTHSWSERYGERHKLVRIEQFPAGIAGPRKVRIYIRSDHYVLQWWDPAEKATLSDRVDGDLVAAITRAREIDDRILHFKSAGQVRHRRIDHATVVQAFLSDLGRRADAGEIDPATQRRYDAALRYYLAFCRLPLIAKSHPNAAGVNREFRLQFDSHLSRCQVTPNGRKGSAVRPMQGREFVLDTVRALYQWASDPGRGNLLPAGFHNPFLRMSSSRTVFRGDPLAAPDITLPMAIELVGACDDFQLALFAPILLFGLRAAEPCFLFQEYFEDEWLRVPCNPDLGYATKGRRDKRFPLIAELAPLWANLRGGRSTGLIYLQRCVPPDGSASRRGVPLAVLVEEYRQRCAANPDRSAIQDRRIRNALHREAGGLTYDDIESEFRAIAKQLGWPAKATLRDLRHLFATTMNNACMPEAYRRYLMGHAPGKAAVTAYTHLDQLERHYGDAVRREWMPLIKAIQDNLARRGSWAFPGNCASRTCD